MISILRQNPSAEALYRLVPYLSHGLYMGFGPKNRCGLRFRFLAKSMWLKYGFWKNGVAMWLK